MLKNKYIHIITFILSLSFFSCSKDDKSDSQTTSNPTGLLLLNSTTINNNTVRIYGKDSLRAGYNAVYLSVTDNNGNAVNSADLTLYPAMDMSGMTMSGPSEQPVYNDSAKLFKAALVFDMNGAWMIHLALGNTSTDLDVTVLKNPLGDNIVSEVTGTDGATYWITYIQPTDPIVGLNNLEILISKKISDTNFLPDSSTTIAFTPVMPSMGHSSPPNNVNPIHQSNGHYMGTANFTMTGDWRLYFDLNKNGSTLVDSAFVDIDF